MRNCLETNPSMIVLARGELVSLGPMGGRWRISCVAGLLWLTVTGHSEDFVLTAGEELMIEGRGKIVVEALRTATVRVERGIRDASLLSAAGRFFSPGVWGMST